MRVLPADVYDTLELSALAFEGIRGGLFCDVRPGTMFEYDLNCPNCAHGLLMAAENRSEPYAPKSLSQALLFAGVGGGMSDNAVCSINDRKGLGSTIRFRVSFREWCKELHVVRGE